MRIIGGEARGRRLTAPRGDATRPTTDRVREALFSMLEARLDLEGTAVLDLYAGSGALALEALSRGAAAATCVERASAARRAITANISTLSYGDRCRLLGQPVARALELLAAGDARFDLVLADPPYGTIEETWIQLARLEPLGLLAAEALLTVEHASRDEAPAQLGALELITRRCYGDSAIALYHLPPPEQAR
jgi:16S rRNA (guanine966-N2)-methyltransferase